MVRPVLFIFLAPSELYVYIFRSQSLFVAIRAVIIRRRLHAAWARTGYADDFFVNHPNLPHAIPGMGRTGARAEWGLGASGTNRKKSKKPLGKKPEIWEIGLEDELAQGLNDEKGKERERGWDGLKVLVGWKALDVRSFNVLLTLSPGTQPIVLCSRFPSCTSLQLPLYPLPPVLRNLLPLYPRISYMAFALNSDTSHPFFPLFLLLRLPLLHPRTQRPFFQGRAMWMCRW